MMDAGRSDAAGKRDRRPRPDSEYAAAREVVRRLQEAGHIAVFAGGCVRDMLLGRPIKDYDVATSAHPREVLRHFRKSLKVGIQFGIVVARLGGWQIEVATFRNDGDYLDGRRPESVEFSTPEEDASRRDFTINGLFYDPEADEVQDFVGGREDLWRGRVRAIGDARARMGEDHLRLLRAVRFAARFGFRLEDETAAVVRRFAGLIRKVSAERIREELSKILADPSRARGIAMALEFGLIKAIDPLWHEALETRSDELLPALRLLPADAPEALCWSLVLPDANLAERCLKSLKASNRLRRDAAEAVRRARRLDDWSEMGTAARKRWLREPESRAWIERARVLALARDGRLGTVRAALEGLAAWGPTGDGSLHAAPRVTGADLKAAGLKPGPKFKTLLRRAEDLQLETGADRDALIAALRSEFPELFAA